MRQSESRICASAALAGLGIVLFPEFAFVDGLRRKRLVPVLGACVVDVGAGWLLYPARRFIPPCLRAFVDLARERFTRPPPWLPAAAEGDEVAARRRRRARRR